MADRNLRRIVDTHASGLSRTDRRNAKRLLKDELKRFENIMIAQRMSGAGYPIDTFLRGTVKEINDDLLSGQSNPFPNIWDIFSAFVIREKGELTDIYRLRNEKDHAFSAEDFFAFANEEELRSNALPKLASLPEGTIHNFTAVGDIREIPFEDEDGNSIVLSGISFVRHGTRLFWISVGGLVCDLDAVTAERRKMLADAADIVRRANPDASEEQIRSIMNPWAVPLEGTDDVWFTATLGLFNLATSSHEIRTFLRDWGVSQAVFSDHFPDRYASDYDTNENIRRMVDKAVAEVENNRLLFDVAETAFALPAYFAARVSYLGELEVQTGLSTGKPHERRLGMKAPPDMRVTMRKVATLDFGRRPHGEHAYTPPRYRVEVDGFWRRLRPDAVGKDANGEPVTGMTWVRGHARWKDRPPKATVVYMKSPVGDALAKVRKKADEKGGEVSLRVS